MKSAFELLLERLERSGFTKEAQHLTQNQNASNGASAPTEQPDMPAKLGAFEILGELGEGGYGFVYLGAQHAPVKRTAAIKMLKKGMDSQAVLTRFRAEQQAMALMDHPNVATIFESGTSADGRPWFAMPLVAGLPIHAHCDLENVSIQARLKLFMDACHGVLHAHQRGILHRDLKPANILISFEDHQAIPKVIDFGIAKSVEGADPLSSLTTQAATPLGTPAYMSPEQFRGDSDARSDIWALGIILGELLCGVRPVRQDPVREMDGRISEPQPERPSLRYARLIHEDPEAAIEVAQQRGITMKILQTQLRGDLDAIVLKCLEIDRDRRYQSVSELLDDLARHMNGEVVEARPPSLLYQTQRFVLRRRLQVAAGAIVLTAMATATAISLRSAARANQEKDAATAVTNFLVETIGAADPFGASGSENISLREVLDAAAKRFQTHPPEQSAQAIAISTALGGTLTQVGQAKEALPLLDRAMELSRTNLGEQSREYLVATEKKALALQALGNFDESLKLYEFVIQESRPRWQTGDASAVATLMNYGLVNKDKGNMPEAERLIREANDRAQLLQGKDRVQTATALGNLAIVLQAAGRFKDAQPLLEAALKMDRELLGDDNATVAGDYQNLAVLQMESNQLEQSEINARLAIDTMRNFAGENHPTTALLMNNLAQTLQERGKTAEAEKLFREALASYLAKFSPDHPDVARVQNNLAFCLRNQGNLAEAEKLFRESLKTNQSRLGADHADVIISLNNLAKILQDQGQLAAALDFSNQSVEKARKVFEKTDPKLWVFIARRGSILASLKKWREADADLQEGLNGLNSIEAPPARIRMTLSDLVKLHNDWTAAEPNLPQVKIEAKKWQDALDQFNAAHPK